jgi:sugar/nucleoside kinase (ribokinase family)
LINRAYTVSVPKVLELIYSVESMRTVKKSTPVLLVVGVGNNALDTIIRLPHFPAPDSKVELLSVEPMPGGQVASAMVACSRWGLRARYIGKIGDDDAGRRQMDEMKRERVEARWIVAHGCSSQSSFVLVDQISGDRTLGFAARKHCSSTATTPRQRPGRPSGRAKMSFQ